MPPVIKLTDQKELVSPKSCPKYVSFPFEKFNPVQSRVFEVFEKDANCVIAAKTSAGKAQPLSSLVLTPGGFKKMGDIRKGGLVISPTTGANTVVLGVFPQGVKEVYKITFSDGVTTRCCKDHLWSVRTRQHKHLGKPYVTLSLEEIRKNIFLNDGQPRWFIPITVPVKMESVSLPLHPYLMGLLLGDGGLKNNVRFTCSNPELIKLLLKNLPKGVILSHQGGIEYILHGGIKDTRDSKRGFVASNFCKKILCDLGLFGKGSCDKFIPKIYLQGDPSQRLLVLQGLMDTDGNANGKKRSPEFSTCSYQLAKDLQHLIQSLGGVTKIRTKQAWYKKQGKKIKCRPAYRLTVNIPFSCFKLSYKKNNSIVKCTHRNRVRAIVDIQKDGVEECCCIKVKENDGLYITDNFVVTHNTVCAELFMSQEVRVRGGKAIYLAPMKALAKEKIDDWTSKAHHFGDLKVSICTGDYRLTVARKKELEEADIIVMTTEMLNSRVRNFASEQNEWLLKIGTMVLDEFHLLTVPGRGDHLEVGLMKFCEINPKARIVALSATMPNVCELADWVSYVLTANDTYLIESDFRPVPLSTHWVKYEKTRRYETTEEEKVNSALEIVESNSDDKFLIFTHTKRTGQMMKTALERAGYSAQFHNADLEKEERHGFEKSFREDPKFQILIATSTLAWGVNTPARRVIIVGVHRGLDEVQPYDIWQMAGRAGRPGYDDRGDVYILLPDDPSECNYHMNRITKDYKVQSRLLDYVGTMNDPHYKTLAFHLVSEIHHGYIKTKDDVHRWYKRSLAHFQAKDLDDGIVEATLNLLIRCGAIREENGEYKCTSVGMVSSMFYYSPFDVADLKSNFSTLFSTGAEVNDLALAVALGNVDSIRMGIVSRAEADEMSSFVSKAKTAEKIFGKSFKDTVWKGAYCYYKLLNGSPLGIFAGTGRNLQFDFPRLVTVLHMLDTMAGKWGQRKYFDTIQKRVSYGVSANLVPFCELSQIGKIRAERLWEAGFRTYKDISGNLERVQAILKLKRSLVEEICNQAMLMSMGM